MRYPVISFLFLFLVVDDSHRCAYLLSLQQPLYAVWCVWKLQYFADHIDAYANATTIFMLLLLLLHSSCITFVRRNLSHEASVFVG